jgi:hypothetical protein
LYATISVNVPGVKPPRGEFVIKNDGENKLDLPADEIAPRRTSVSSTCARKPKSTARCGIYERVTPLSRSGSPSGW